MENITSLLFIVFFLLISIINVSVASKKCKPPTAIYAFGDSIFDAGNNNNLLTICRANHKPYGVDFPGESPTGRFSNGKLPGDIMISDFGIKDLLPAYADAGVDEEELLTGVTFASSCSGFHDLTASEVGVLTFDKQFKNFEKAFLSMEENFGLSKASAVVENALFLISGGSNDMMDNYYIIPFTRLKYSLPSFHDMLLKNLETFVKKLHHAGAKRLGVMGMPPLGCLPVDVTTNFGSQENANVSVQSARRECKSKHNSDAQEYNTKLQARIKKMMVAMPELKIAYMDIYSPLMEMIDNPNQFGFKTTHEGCCGTGAIELGPLCSLFSFFCNLRSEYIFWDSAHPTEAAYKDLTKIFLDKVLPDLLN